MQIGQIAYTYKPIIGGAEAYISTLYKLLKEKGAKQKVYQVKNKSAQGPEFRLIPAWKILRRKPLHLYNLFLNMHFTSLKKEDVLIIHDPFHFWPVAWHKNTVVISHGVRWDRPDKSENMYNRAHLASAKFSMKYAKKIVANDTNFYRKLGYRLKPKEKMFAQVDKNRWFIPNCVDTNIFKKVKPYSSLVKLNTILVPRNIVPGRGIHLAISAFSRFHKKYENTLLVICGSFFNAKPNYQNQLFGLINKLDLVGKVLFIGSVDWKNMPKIYSSSQMTIIPTLYEEGTSLAALESMSCKTACISTNVGGLPDLPVCLAKPNVRDLASKMITVYEKRQKISVIQQKEVRKIHNLDNFRKAWWKVLNNQ